MPTEDITVPGGTPDAVAWRLANVEQGLKDTRTEMKDMRQALETKLDGIVSGFATHKDIETAKEQAKLEHAKINEVEDDVISLRKEVKDEINFLRKRNWVQNTLSAILGAILAVFVTYFINDILN